MRPEQFLVHQTHRSWFLSKTSSAGFLASFFLITASLWQGVAHADLSALAPMPTSRIEHAATLLANGSVLLTGGRSTENPQALGLNTSAIYNPLTNSWSAGPTMNARRSYHVSLRLTDGRVIVFGGAGGIGGAFSGIAETTAELYNPISNSFTLTTKPPGGLCINCRALLLSDGRALFFGGSTSSGTPNYAFEVYNPTSNTWSQLGNTVDFQAGNSLVGITGGKLLVVGNIFNQSYPFDGLATPASLYDIATSTSITLPPAFPAQRQTGFVKEPLLVKLPDGRVLAAFGERTVQTPGASRISGNTAASIFNPANNSWTPTASSPNTQIFANAITAATLITPDVVAFIEFTSGAVLYYRISTGTWTNSGLVLIPDPTTNVSLAPATPNAVAALENGELLIPRGTPTSLLRNNLTLPPVLVTSLQGINTQAGYQAVRNFPFTTEGGLGSAFTVQARQGQAANVPATGIALRLEILSATSTTPLIGDEIICTTPTITDNDGRSTFSCIAGSTVGIYVVRVRPVTGAGVTAGSNAVTQFQLNVIAGTPPPPASFPPATPQTISLLAGTAGITGGGVVNGVPLAGRTFNTANVITDRDGNIFFTNADGLIYCISARSGLLFTIGGIGSVTLGINGFGGDGGLATLATFNNPTGLVFDAAGNLYIADTGNNRVRRINLVTGIVTTIAGGGASLADNIQGSTAQLTAPRSIAFGPDGLLYIADGSNRIRRLNVVTGNLSFFAGTGVAGYGGDNGAALSALFSDIYYITFDFQGNLFIVDRGNNRIRCINRAGIVLPVAGTGVLGFGGDDGLAINALFRDIRSIAFDFWGQLYISDAGNGRIRRLNLLTGLISTFNVNNNPFNPYGLYFDTLGSLYTAELGLLRAVRFIDNPGFALSFPTRSRVAAGTQVLSDERFLTGFTGSVALGIDGGEYNIGCSAANPFVSGLTTITISNPAQKVCLRVTAGAAAGDARTANFRVNNTSSPFTVLTLDPDLLPRYRIYVPSLKRHLYTTDTNEYNVLTGFAATYSGEGISHYLYKGAVGRAAQTAIPYYRLYFNPQRRHFYSSDFGEYNSLRSNAAFASDEGITGYVFPRYGIPGATPLYRLYNPAINSHLWTIDSNEFNFLRQNGWTPEGQLGNAAGVDGYVFP